MQGQGRELTTIRVPDSTLAFSGDNDSSKAVIWTGRSPAQRFRNTIRDLTVNNGAALWILGTKTEKIGTIIHTKNGGFTDLLGCFIYSNRGWDAAVPAFVVENAAANLCGLNERNYNRQPCSFWFRERLSQPLKF